jgi:hypothetical protein
MKVYACMHIFIPGWNCEKQDADCPHPLHNQLTVKPFEVRRLSLELVLQGLRVLQNEGVLGRKETKKSRENGVTVMITIFCQFSAKNGGFFTKKQCYDQIFGKPAVV